ncbi:MAG: arylesterase [Gemmatimonadetes bacterium]|nr:arylesterase [Gemmatimonadota bacterium]
MAGAGPAAAPAAQPARPAAAPDPARVILFVGTSLTAGYGVGADSAYPAVIQRWLDSAGLRYRVSNAGISGETSAGGLRRMAWSLQVPIDVLVLELGANDGLRGLDPGQLRANLDSIIRLTLARYPKSAIVIAGMEAPPNLGEHYGTAFRRVFPELARQYHATLVPFLLAGVAAVDSLNQADGMHPTAAGHRVVAANVWQQLEPLLRARLRRARDAPSKAARGAAVPPGQVTR